MIKRFVRVVSKSDSRFLFFVLSILTLFSISPLGMGLRTFLPVLLLASFVLAYRLRSLFVGFFLLSVFSFQILTPNKLYATQVLSSFDLGSNPTYSAGKIISYGFTPSTILLFFSLLSMVADTIKAKNFGKTKNNLYKFVVLLSMAFLFFGLVGSNRFSPFPVLSAVWTLYYYSTFLVAYLLYHFWRNHLDKFRLFYKVIIFSIVLQFAISVGQFIGNSKLGLPIEAGVVVNFPGQVDESRLIGSRVSGTLLLHNQLGLALMVFILLLLPNLKNPKSFRTLFVITVIALVNVVLTQSRSAWVAITLGVLFFLRLYYRELRVAVTRVLTLRFLVYGVFLFSTLLVVVVPRLLLSFDTATLGGGLDYRRNVVEEGIQVLSANPWFGYGAQTNEYFLFHFFPRGTVFNFPFPVHEGHLQFLLEFGLIGFFLFIAPFYILTRAIINRILKEKDFFGKRKDYIFRFIVGSILFNIYYLFLSHGDIVEFQYLGLILGFGLIIAATNH